MNVKTFRIGPAVRSYLPVSLYYALQIECRQWKIRQSISPTKTQGYSSTQRIKSAFLNCHFSGFLISISTSKASTESLECFLTTIKNLHFYCYSFNTKIPIITSDINPVLSDCYSKFYMEVNA